MNLEEQFNNLSKILDITESTTGEIQTYIKDRKSLNTPTKIEAPEVKALEVDFIGIDLMSGIHADVGHIRNTIRETTESARILLSQISDEVAMNGASDSELISSYSSLMATVNSSTKMLMTLYKDLMDLEYKNVKINKEKNKNTSKEDSSEHGDVKIGNINLVVASTFDIIKAKKELLLQENIIDVDV